MAAMVTVVAPVAPAAVEAQVPVRIRTVQLPAPTDDLSFATRGWSVTEARDTTPFAVVGLELPGEIEVEIRTAMGDGDWSDWAEMPHQEDEGPDPGSAEARGAKPGHRTHPVYTGPADRLQLRTTTPVSDSLQVYLIDPFGLDRSALDRTADRLGAAWRGTTESATLSQADMPYIVPRSEWGADEALVRHPPVYAAEVDRAFVHHTAGPNGYTREEAPGIVRAIMAYHVEANGWSDIGYNFLVDRFGTIYEGRAGGMDAAVVGAHAGGFNTFATGVALMGTYTTATPEPVMIDALAEVLAWKADIHHFHPQQVDQATSGGSTRYVEDTVVTLDNISGHRDVSLTTCPGDGSYALLPEIRDRVRELAGELIVNHADGLRATQLIRGRPDESAVTITAELDPVGPWTIEAVDPDGALIGTASGDGTQAEMTIDLTTGTWDLGEYRWVVASPGRTPAEGSFAVELPTIDHLTASPAPAEADTSGRLVPPVTFTAELWDDAEWELLISDPDGALVFGERGRGATLEAEWTDGVTTEGRYRVTVAAENAEPVRLDIDVTYDLSGRLAAAEDPIAGAVAISQATFEPGGATRAVLARHDVFADALAGGPLAGTEGPLLLTPGERLDQRVAAELDRVLAPDAEIYVLGGPAALSHDVTDVLADTHDRVVRLSGAGRVATAAAVAEVVVGRSGTGTAMIARAGPDDAAPWADALSGGAFGAYAGVPVLLTDTAVLSADTDRALTDLGITDTVVLGGTAAVGQVTTAALPDPVRVAGDERTGTAVAIAERLWTTGDRSADPIQEVLLANGYDDDAWGYALASAPASASMRAPLLITGAHTLSPPTAAHLEESPALVEVTVVGPETLVDAQVESTAAGLLR